MIDLFNEYRGPIMAGALFIIVYFGVWRLGIKTMLDEIKEMEKRK